jgi:hypothetical protein
MVCDMENFLEQKNLDENLERQFQQNLVRRLDDLFVDALQNLDVQILDEHQTSVVVRLDEVVAVQVDVELRHLFHQMDCYLRVVVEVDSEQLLCHLRMDYFQPVSVLGLLVNRLSRNLLKLMKLVLLVKQEVPALQMQQSLL